MHAHLIDWLRNVEIQSDEQLADRRWKTAHEYSGTLVRANVPRLLRLFLFARPDPADIKWFADGLSRLDKGFPVANNTEILRLMSGVVMTTTFEANSEEGDAFALGLRVSTFPRRTIQPAEPAILSEAHAYLQATAEKRRPSNFNEAPMSAETSLDANSQELAAALAGTDAATTRAQLGEYNKMVATAITASHKMLSEQIRRLAEESALLWWVLGEYSTSLERRTTGLTRGEYALAAGAEAADRTHILPPPPSAGALLTRALKPCKADSKKPLTLVDFLNATDRDLRATILKRIDIGASPDLVPLTTGLAKTEEFDDAAAAVKVLPRICPGVKVEHAISPSEAAQQFYDELMFLKALRVLAESR
jgi:GTPase-associated system helical domain